MKFGRFDIKPQSYEYGYKWVINKLCDVFIVKLKLNNCYITCNCGDYSSYEDYLSTDCVVDEIFRLKDQKPFPRVLNGAIYAFDFTIGKRITGMPIFFYPTLELLFQNQTMNINKHLKEHIHLMNMIDEYNKRTDKGGREFLREQIRNYINEKRPMPPDLTKFENTQIIDWEPDPEPIPIPEYTKFLLSFDGMSEEERKEKILFEGFITNKFNV